MKSIKLLQHKAELAFKEAVRGVIERHKQTGRPLVVWEDNKVKRISPDEALRKFKQAEKKDKKINVT